GIRSFTKAIKDLLIAANHAEFLARDALLCGAVALHQPEKTAQRIDLSLQRIDLSRDHTGPGVKHVEIARAVFPARDREKDRDHDERPPHISLHRFAWSETSIELTSSE